VKKVFCLPMQHEVDLSVCLMIISETVIPICPPACGQNYFSINAAVALNQVDVALPVLILICMFRNWRLY